MESIAEEFETRWNFPDCSGAIDGKHVWITPPANSSSYYYNYKRFFSIVLMAVVNANYEFIFVDVGEIGQVSDGSFKQTTCYEKLMSHILNTLSAEETKHSLNFVFVADVPFALHEHIMKPSEQRGLTKEKGIYHYRLLRAQCIVDDAFGILSDRFRIFQISIQLCVENIDWVAMACCELHSFLCRKTHLQRTTYTTMPDDPEHTN